MGGGGGGTVEEEDWPTADASVMADGGIAKRGEERQKNSFTES